MRTGRESHAVRAGLAKAYPGSASRGADEATPRLAKRGTGPNAIGNPPRQYGSTPRTGRPRRSGQPRAKAPNHRLTEPGLSMPCAPPDPAHPCSAWAQWAGFPPRGSLPPCCCSRLPSYRPSPTRRGSLQTTTSRAPVSACLMRGPVRGGSDGPRGHSEASWARAAYATWHARRPPIRLSAAACTE